jgi:ZIP family zinc transporter
MSALAAAGWSALAAFPLIVGAWVAVHRRPSPAVTGQVLGIGAGALIAAVAYTLVPKGHVESARDFLALGAGAVTFFGVDAIVARRAASEPSTGSGSNASRSIVIGALLDGIPESLVLGMGLAVRGTVSASFMAAVFLSNLPESLGATTAMQEEGQPPGKAYWTWWGIVAVSAACGAIGYGLVDIFPNADGHYVEAFAAGSVLAMLADSMMPEAFERGGRLTGLCTALGFAAAGALSLVE